MYDANTNWEWIQSFYIEDYRKLLKGGKMDETKYYCIY
jgi:hypothetical protein